MNEIPVAREFAERFRELCKDYDEELSLEMIHGIVFVQMMSIYDGATAKLESRLGELEK